MSTRLGLLHTVPALADSFQSGIRARRPDVDLVHVVDSALLETAIDVGVTDEVTERVAAHIGYLQRCGARAILATCSSIGEAVEQAAESATVPVLRVDTAMARTAVDTALRGHDPTDGPGRIAVLATLEATLGPTGRLLERAAADADVRVQAHVVEGAAAARSAGRPDEHNRLIAAALLDAAARSDVIVLAQASMAEAAADAPTDVPVLTSPDSGTAALLHTLDENP
ncbi:hypothetical protein SAMN04489806_1187 [Paramicrobacterium humi]|uniref:Asp/Glu/Hydantoin racemase n=1 Tax=Paramicrobacterium humi TaxID=640635 RepID=A0A1H4KJM2_9MICO|nr:aspartate/glutamate racemase family protein [Microbacterium humi]SEB58436.1 hypothetical protein SAMN04489806_1187 [Microbacterium humi]